MGSVSNNAVVKINSADSGTPLTIEAGTGVSVDYDSETNTYTISATGGSSSGGYEPLVAEGFNTNIPYLDEDYYVPNFITSTNGDIVMGA